jgi:NAD(P)-dependent dehydrogenase (short-subunit alcohol dehydrogenase family)
MISARRENKLQEAKAMIEASAQSGGKIEYVVADMSKEEDIKKAINACQEVYGGVPLRVVANVVQNNWAYTFETTPDEHFLNAHNELVMSVVHLVRAVLPAMKEAKFGRGAWTLLGEAKLTVWAVLNLGTVAIKEPHRWHYLYVRPLAVRGISDPVDRATTTASW